MLRVSTARTVWGELVIVEPTNFEATRPRFPFRITAILLQGPLRPTFPWHRRERNFFRLWEKGGGPGESRIDHAAVEASIAAMVERVRRYVPGYRLKQPVQFETFDSDNPLHIPETGKFMGTRVTAMLQVAGAAHYLPAYAGNLDIMTSAALATAERIAAHSMKRVGVSK
jgi:hypothetical protein